ncbi:MAG: NUDIX hydrolase [Caulobacter sp. 12-67-6]|nr:MAG: NUDIX hydrolase [Caulobacter sp. 12-67-6]OYX70183.1 MAG: NUDIX hydrolase [Caulobacter sp. 32-67-35]OYX93924.1 MAG: NUDIX hydrolase [Caulobacter sp. 35-67-4]OZA84271.1 MAG: NUDIX hydrolase [Caulobacter sp. 39-67-4]HQR88939.1 NUDIX hydrolase [Caulobacter sp.]
MTEKPVKRATAKADDRRRQVAALPWRGAGQSLQILLVSSRETKRWVIPKGWPMKGRSDPAAAAQEAYEEAGLDGVIAEQSIGDYEYLKRLKSGVARLVRVDVYPFQVTGGHAVWPEKGQRVLQWMSPIEAALGVQEPELRELIARFAGVDLPDEERPAPARAPTPVRVALQRLRRRVTALWGRARRP